MQYLTVPRSILGVRVPIPPNAFFLRKCWVIRTMTIQDDIIETVLRQTKVIALVGASANPARPSYGVMAYLMANGYRVIPVNPGLAGQELMGQLVYADLTSIPDEVDMVDIFRQSVAVPAIVEEALLRWPTLKVVWTQLGVVHDGAAAMAETRGVTVIQDRCPKIEIARLGL